MIEPSGQVRGVTVWTTVTSWKVTVWGVADAYAGNASMRREKRASPGIVIFVIVFKVSPRYLLS
jgi:hypothetical protein